MSDFDPPRQASRPLWILATLGALALHAGGIVLALKSVQPDDSDRDLGAPAIAIGIALMAPHVEPTDRTVGPDTQAATAAPAVVEQKTQTAQTELPQAVPTETDDPDRAVAPNEKKKPKEDEPKIATVQAQPSTASAASEETAMPAAKAAAEAPRTVAPAPGTGESARRDRVTWQKELAVHFNKYKRYPADRTMRQAEVVVSFVLDRAGHVLSTRIVKGSGDASFDEAALAMLRRADPVPPPPPLVADAGLTFTLPVIFHVEGRN